MISALFWLMEFCLESWGAYYAFKRRIWPLALYLGFRAIADIGTFSTLMISGQTAYCWADFYSRTAAYVLFWFLSIYAVAKVLKEDSYKLYLALTLIFGTFAVVWFHAQPLTMGRIWRFEMWADMIAAALVCMAMGTQEIERRSVARPWAMVSLGIFVQGASDGLLSAAQYQGIDVTAYYPLGAILALGIWAYGARLRESEPVRLPLGQRLPVSGWIVKEYRES